MYVDEERKVRRSDSSGVHKGELLRWIFSILLAGVVSYLTTISTLSIQIARLETRQQSQFEEIQRTLTEIKIDIREFRRGSR
jgi:hypothetical protein